MSKKMKRHENILRFVEANMEAEGFKVSESVKCDCKSMLEGKTTADKLVCEYIKIYCKR